ncbi:uncharacterized protein LOC106054685 isoform X1 [Biomphalaria glabrata]|uniref:RING-type E3 ubiquitin transferase n=1 Tax=Biomphalaria glabrata TaxID=6526 RepID=A0A9W2YSR7_BIOGL|nr:uncharacterized protein LOC106054685 isoform X1 [Biomphalaria glabrata]XP_055865774.1 uncharacterized protein LOC106054685 isoform X1 [Biomphalaria glabrata]
MSSDDELLALQLQEEEIATAGLQCTLFEGTLGAEGRNNLEIARILSLEEENLASEHLIKLIKKNGDLPDAAFQELVSRCQQEITQSCAQKPCSVLQQEEASAIDINNSTYQEDNDDATYQMIARVVQKEEADSYSYHNALQLQQQEEEEMEIDATSDTIARITQQDEMQTLSYLSALRLQEEENDRMTNDISQAKLFNNNAVSIPNSSRTKINDFFIPTEEVDEIDADCELIGATAAAPPLHHNTLKKDLNLATDEQMARLIQEEEDAEELAQSIELALKLQMEEEAKAKRRGRGSQRDLAYRNTFTGMPHRGQKEEERQPRHLTGARSRPPFNFQPMRQVLAARNHVPAEDFFYEDMNQAVIRSFGNFSDHNDDDPPFLLPPGLEGFNVEPGQNLDIITIPHNSNYEELIALSESIGEVSCGLSVAQINTFPVRRWRADVGATKGEGDNCSICISDFENNEEVRRLPCKHEFHKKCVDPWIKDKPNCPTCRADLKEKMKSK